MAPDAVLDLDALLDKLPAGDRAAAEGVSKELVKGGQSAVAALVAKLGGAADAKARTALHGLALYTARPGAAAERKAFAEALAAHLGGKAPAGAKAFVLGQLEHAGGPEVVPAVAKLLPDAELGGPAARALVAVGGEPAAAALREALPKAAKGRKADVAQALGALRDKKAVGALLKAAADPDKGVRLAALRALGDIGDPKATDALTKAAAASPSYERARVVDACLALARRLEEGGETEQARAVYEKLLAGVKDEKTRATIERLRKGVSKP